MTTKYIKTLAFIGLLSGSIGLSSCEDVIEVDLDEGTAQLAVDAFVTDADTTQLIRLTVTDPYFDNSGADGALNAMVNVTDDLGNIYSFTDAQNDGNYRWNAAGADTGMVSLGRTYTLTIAYDGEIFESMAMANPVPTIDSITYEFREAELGLPEGYYAAFYATDFAGREDYYWIKPYRNDTLFSDPSQMSLCKDAAYSGNGADGFMFIIPVRESITPFGEVYRLGDNIRVEMWSISAETFGWLREAQTQMVNGGLFATPPSNVRTNISNVNSSSEVTAVGMFNVAMEAKDFATVQ